MYATADMPFFRPLPGLGTNTSPTAVSTEVENSLAASLAAAAPLSGPAAPFLLAAAGIAKALAALGVGAGCGQTCIQATNLVNTAEPNFLTNVQQYEAGEISQEQAQANYQSMWQALEVACSAIPGSAGQDCISDRQQGACTWKQTSTGDTLGLPGVPAEGQCWNWYDGYFVPLTYPPQNAPSATTEATGDVSSALSSVGISSSLAVPLLIGAAVLAGWLVLK